MQETKPIRVAQIMGKLNAGGVEAVIYNYYRRIDHTRIQFDFIVDGDSHYAIPDDILEAGARCYVVPPYQKVFKYISALKKLFKENGYDAVHSNMTTLAVFSLYAAKKAKVPVRICHSHSTAGKGETLRNILKAFLKPLAKLYATDYFACSEYAGKWLFGKRALKKGKVKILYNAIDSSKFSFNPKIRKVIREDFGIGENQTVVGHIGRFMPQKNHSFLIDVFYEFLKLVPDSRLLLLGDGPLFEEMQNKAEGLKISDKVIFAGIRPDPENYYQAMDVFLFPSNYEGLGLVAVEAQASGLSVLASDQVPKEADACGRVEFLSLSQPAEVWAQNLKRLCGDNCVNANARAESAGFNSEKFDIAEQAQNLQEWYLERVKK